MGGLIASDLSLIYNELHDATALYNGVTINLFYEDDYEVQSMREKVIRVQKSDVQSLINSDTFTIDAVVYRVISFQESQKGLEMIVGIEK